MFTSRLQSAGFTRRFRNAANEFRQFPDDGRIPLVKQGKAADGRPCKIIEGVRTADKLKEVCGVWLIEAHKLGLVPGEQTDLVHLIEEHANPYPKDEPLPPGAFMRRERCPYNLFLDICAGGIVVGRIVERNDRTELEPDGEAPQGRAWSNPGRFVTCIDGKPVEVFTDRRKRYRETGGLMEAALPGAVQQRPMERCAEACEWLADLIEHAPRPCDQSATPTTPAIRAGRAFMERIESDPAMRAAWEQTRERLQVFVKAIQVATNSPEYREAVEAQKRAIQEVVDTIQSDLEAARDTLAIRHLGRPETLEEWEHLARVIEMPDERLRTGDYTMRDVFQFALAWADRQTAKARLAAEAGRPNAGPAKQGEGGTPPADRSKGIPLAEAEIKVRDWLATNAKDNPAAITRDAVAAGTGVSAGQVSNTAAWKAFRERRDAETKLGAREIPLTDPMQAAMPSDCERPDELAALIEEQTNEEAEQERRHKRRHGPS